MLVIHNKQIEAFKEDSKMRFEDEMVDHIKEFFPDHYFTIEEKKIRETIQLGMAKAEQYELISKRNICLYINNMFFFGSNFDNDPQYPWVKPVLIDKTEEPITRIDRLSDIALDVYNEFSGSDNINFKRVLHKLMESGEAIFQNLIQQGPETVLNKLNELFPEKYEVVTEINLQNMIAEGSEKSPRYGLTYDSSKIIYIVLMFLFGSRFDVDPQFYWAGEILNQGAIRDQNEKTSLLYNKMISVSTNFISGNNQKIILNG